MNFRKILVNTGYFYHLVVVNLHHFIHRVGIAEIGPGG